MTGLPDVAGTPATPLRAFVDELVAAGVRDAVVCPGSRSTPMALALAADRTLRVLVHLDERGAGFLALGLAKAARRPVVVLVTSGTAAANLLPAVVEADAGRVPLIVLTADRPPELRDRGAPQTIDQVRMYGRFVRWDAELPVPSDHPMAVAHLRHVVGRAVAQATRTPFGPVHLDLPYREPLLPDGPLGSDDPSGPSPSPAPFTRVVRAEATPMAVPEPVVDRVARARHPVIWCGPIDEPSFPDAVARLAARMGAPILADGLANLRQGPHDRSRVIARTATVLRGSAFTVAHRPDLVLRFGGTPTSRTTLEWLAGTEAEHIVVDDGGWDEPTLHPSLFVHADPAWLARTLAHANEVGRRAEPAWVGAWLAADRRVDQAISSQIRAIAAAGEPFEGGVFAALGDALPDGAILWSGSSMPVRDLDAFLPGGDARVRCLANRGANGIDGVVSSALGASVADAGPVVLVLGDLSFLHDINALATARVPEPRLTIVLVHNDGGGIFSFLPQATADRPELGLPDRYEQLLGTPHGTDLAGVARALGARVTELRPDRIAPAVAAAIDRPGIELLVLRTERARNAALHAQVLHAALGAIG
ncbi:MAG: 2-succinyl-5-enolpyruvyl-6-hydroxy-3-cyclohexene-1-carboxylic-acid synthase [Chloroflexota bacterium]